MARPPYAWGDHGNFAAGMIQDVPRHMLPEGAVWDALDCFVSKDGTLHKRGATTTALSAGSTISGSVVGLAQSETETTLLKGYIVDESNGGGNAFIVGAFTPAAGTFAVTSQTVGAGTALVNANGVGRPFQHGGYAIVPIRALTAGSTAAYRMFLCMAGSTNTIRSSTTSLTITSGSREITGFSAPDVAAMAAGDVIYITKNAAFDEYMGRVTSISGTTVRVAPTPTRSFTSGTGSWLSQTTEAFLEFVGTGLTSWRGAQGGASWQNRLLFGGVTREVASGVYEHLQDYIIWSLLPTETSSVNTLADGDLWLSNYGWPANNYARVPWMNKVMGLEPVSDGELFVTGRPICSRLVGTLNTNTSTSGGLTYELRPLNQKVQCIDDRATTRTPQGVMMMGPDGIYLYREGNLINTMVGRIQNYFLANIANAVVYGAGVLPNNHYYLSTEAGTLLCNMDGFRWTRFLAPNTQITNSFNDPSDTTRVFAARYKPTTASNTTKLHRADYLVNPGSAATTDVSGTGPTMTVKTAAYDNDSDASQLNQFRHTLVTARMPGSTGTVTVTATPGLDGEETPATLGTISVATSAQTKRYDTTTMSRAMAYTIAQTGNPDECELINVDVAIRPARKGRVA